MYRQTLTTPLDYSLGIPMGMRDAHVNILLFIFLISLSFVRLTYRAPAGEAKMGRGEMLIIPPAPTLLMYFYNFIKHLYKQILL